MIEQVGPVKLSLPGGAPAAGEHLAAKAAPFLFSSANPTFIPADPPARICEGESRMAKVLHAAHAAGPSRFSLALRVGFVAIGTDRHVPVNQHASQESDG